MPILYDNFNVRVDRTQMVTSTQIPVSLSGKRLRLTADVADAGDAFFVYFPGYNSRPVRHYNGDTVQTPRNSFGSLICNLGDGYAIVVSGKEFIAERSIREYECPVLFAGGRQDSVCVGGTLKARISCSDPEKLALDYVQHAQTDPVGMVGDVIAEECFRLLDEYFAESCVSQLPLTAVNLVSVFCKNAVGQVIARVVSRFPWLDITYAELSLAVKNRDEIITHTNEAFEFEKTVRMRLLDTVTTFAMRGGISEGVSKVLQVYLSNCAQLPSRDDMLEIIDRLVELDRNGINALPNGSRQFLLT